MALPAFDRLFRSVVDVARSDTTTGFNDDLRFVVLDIQTAISHRQTRSIELQVEVSYFFRMNTL
jgi:hypothetical protein